MLTTDELTRMRDTAAAALPGTAYVLRGASADDGIGGRTDTWGTAGTVAVRLAPRGGSEASRGGATLSEADSVASLPYGVDLKARDRLSIDGLSYEVLNVRRHSWQITTAADVKELRSGGTA